MPARTKVKSAASPSLQPRLETLAGVRDVRDHLASAIDKSVRRRPIATLLLAVCVGFVLGTTWAR
jgi:hypothetical protein